VAAFRSCVDNTPLGDIGRAEDVAALHRDYSDFVTLDLKGSDP